MNQEWSPETLTTEAFASHLQQGKESGPALFL